MQKLDQSSFMNTGLERASFTRLQQASEGHALQSTQVIVLQQTHLIIGQHLDPANRLVNIWKGEL